MGGQTKTSYSVVTDFVISCDFAISGDYVSPFVVKRRKTAHGEMWFESMSRSKELASACLNVHLAPFFAGRQSLWRAPPVNRCREQKRFAHKSPRRAQM